ncbi:unnamed protein product [Rotaria magnacalcarata]|uniref:Uncharacterized protein n=1 Tax=Rotaria magnacalcarata TaxID=392030 RepID=A0A820SFD7_9BILA|nr:unnamed protein product [Rotaria magnacalcarata]
MHQALSSITKTTTEKLNSNTNKLRKIAILIYKIMVIQTYQYWWKTYFKSGTGQFIIPSETKQKLSYSATLSIRPKEIKTIVLSNKKDKTNGNEICLKFLNGQLNALQHQLKQYQQELNIKANNFQGYTISIQEKPMTYTEQNLSSSLTLQLEYFQHKPNEYQEYEFLKQQIAYYNLPSQSFECSTISHHPFIDSTQNLTVREALKKQFKEVAIQSRITLFNIYLKSAEDQREEYKKKHAANIKKMDASQHTLNKNEKLSSTLVQLFNERCNKISERIRSIYKFTSESTLLKS